MIKRFKSRKAYKKYTAYVKMHKLSKRKKGHSVYIHGKKHKVKHGRKK